MLIEQLLINYNNFFLSFSHKIFVKIISKRMRLTHALTFPEQKCSQFLSHFFFYNLYFSAFTLDLQFLTLQARLASHWFPTFFSSSSLFFFPPSKKTRLASHFVVTLFQCLYPWLAAFNAICRTSKSLIPHFL